MDRSTELELIDELRGLKAGNPRFLMMLSRQTNWKILVEGGIEAYHFRVAHRATIGPHIENNLSPYRKIGVYLRSVLPRKSRGMLKIDARKDWNLREYANILYTLFPSCSLLVQQGHIG